MINFRFHIVSLIAIFLALALGVVIGAGVIDRGVVDALDNRLNTVEAKSDRIKSANDQLEGANQQLQQAITDMQPFAVDGRLVGDEIAVVAVRGVSGDQVGATVKAAQQGGATVNGTLWLESKWNLQSADDVKALQTAIASSTKNKVALRAEGYHQLAERLAAPPGDTGDATTDVLVRLQQAGFVGFDAVGGVTLSTFPGRAPGMVLVTGTQGSLPAASVVMPLAAAIHAVDMPLVVADDYVETANGPSRGEELQPLRASDLARTVSTVDDLDLPQGPTTVVLALADLFRNPPIAGRFGYGTGAQPFPDPVGS